MSWSYAVPKGMRRRLEAVLGQRSIGPAEIWGEVRDWLVENGVEMPEHIEFERPPESVRRDQ